MLNLKPRALKRFYSSVLLEVCMDKWTFGWTILVVGMGGTLLTLGLMSLIMSALKKVFPYKKEEEEG